MNTPAVIPPSPRYSPSKAELTADIERLEKYNDWLDKSLVQVLDSADKVSGDNKKLRAENNQFKRELKERDRMIDSLRAVLHAMGGSMD